MSVYLRFLILTLHKAHDSEEDSSHPRLRSLWVFLWGREKGFRVVFQFLVAMGTRVRVKEIAEFDTAVRTFRSVHFDLLAKGWTTPLDCT